MTNQPATSTSDNWISETRAAMRQSETNFFRVKPWRYWLDFVVSATFAYTAAGIYLAAPLFSVVQLVAFCASAFGLYRVGSLVHEVCHLGEHEMRGFKTAWNLVVGVMTLTPSTFFTKHHRDHHTLKHYGTPNDPEYVANVCSRGNAASIGLYAVHVLAFPLLVFARFLLAPLTFAHPKLREYVLRHASSSTLNWRKYERDTHRMNRKRFAALELLCWVRASMIPVAVLLGWSDWTRLPLLYALGAVVVVMNQLRQLADHHLESDGDHLSLADHITDSCNYTSRDPLTSLLFPFAIRYHALHHLFPSLPYHNLAAAHAYLSQHLPSESPYHQLEQPNWWTTAKKIFSKPEEPPVILQLRKPPTAPQQRKAA